MKVELEDSEKMLILRTIGPVLTTVIESLLHRNGLEATEVNTDAVTDAVCEFMGGYYGGQDNDN